MNDTHAMMRVAPMSAPAMIFGIGGLVPFVVLAAMIRFGPDTWYGYWLMALSYYGAVILTFVGALHWGYALKRCARGGKAWSQYGFSVAPAIVAWLSLLFPVWTGLRLQAAGLMLCYAYDRAVANVYGIPAWFLSLRALLTVSAVASLTLASLL